MSIEEKNLISDRLNLLASKSEDERTFTGFIGFLTNNRLKRIYENYVNGTYKTYFNREKKLEKNNFVVYEMDSILKDTKLVNFLLSYLFFTIEHEMLDGNPTLILIDEAWMSLDNEYISR